VERISRHIDAALTFLVGFVARQTVEARAFLASYDWLPWNIPEFHARKLGVENAKMQGRKMKGKAIRIAPNEIIRAAMSILGSKTSARKARACRRNGKLGGRPCKGTDTQTGIKNKPAVRN
jgi:hypothetical protein